MQRLLPNRPMTDRIGLALLPALVLALTILTPPLVAKERPDQDKNAAKKDAVKPQKASAETIQRADSRWAEDGPGGEPDFTRHVVPLLGKVGCTNRACHGSFQGQGASDSACSATTPASITRN